MKKKFEYNLNSHAVYGSFDYGEVWAENEQEALELAKKAMNSTIRLMNGALRDTGHNIDVDFDGQEVFEFDSNRYIFLGIKLDDYSRFIKLRSPKWRTVTLPADKFRQSVLQLTDIIN